MNELIMEKVLKDFFKSKTKKELRKVIYKLIVRLKETEEINYHIIDDPELGEVGTLRLYDEISGESIFPSDDLVGDDK